MYAIPTRLDAHRPFDLKYGLSCPKEINIAVSYICSPPSNRVRRAAKQFRQETLKKPPLEPRNAEYTVIQPIGLYACRLVTPPGIHKQFHALHLKRPGDDLLPSQLQGDTFP